MNIKLHTPKSLMTGSGMATAKQLMLSIVATTISIVLTFGTAAFLEHNKKQEAKREMVMVLLYDLANILEQTEKADSALRAGFEQQVAVAANPKLFEQNPFFLIPLLSAIDFKYTETVERIFSSNIETINTLGNVLFAETVSDFYRIRKTYKEEVCNGFMQEYQQKEGIPQYEHVVDVDICSFITMSGIYLCKMKDDFAQCKQMMDVSDADLEAFHQKRQEMAQTETIDSISYVLKDEMIRNEKRLKEAKNKGKRSEE
ncbi:MAG: hypothetical protein J5506_06980 [Prevotella sp.]|nr:hypothetical protein [Prevotella sp.]